jgi:hypothetical protein
MVESANRPMKKRQWEVPKVGKTISKNAALRTYPGEPKKKIT